MRRSRLPHIIEQEIKASGSFKEKLADYAHAFGRTQRFDAAKAETIVRDLFKARMGRTMNDLRSQLVERGDKLTEEEYRKAANYADQAGDMVRDGNKMTFHRALAAKAEELANYCGITHADAKRAMREAYEQAEGTDLYEHGKALDEEFYRPQIEAEQKQRSESQSELAQRERHNNSGRQAYRPRNRTR